MVGERKEVGSPPDDAGHTGSDTTPDQTMIEYEVGSGPAPHLSRDQQRVLDRPQRGLIPAIVALAIVLLFLILLVFTPR